MAQSACFHPVAQIRVPRRFVLVFLLCLAQCVFVRLLDAPCEIRASDPGFGPDFVLLRNRHRAQPYLGSVPLFLGKGREAFQHLDLFVS